MKKFITVLAVLALTLTMASVAMAEVTVSGSVDIRSLELNNNTDFTDKVNDRLRNTQERIRINVDAKNDNVKGRVTFENDWQAWGASVNNTTGGLLSGGTVGVESRPGESTAANRFGFREAWIDFTIPGAQPAHVKVGHQFL